MCYYNICTVFVLDNIVDATEAVLGNAEATLDVADKSDVHVQDSEFEEEVTLSDIPVITNGVESIHVERKQSFVQVHLECLTTIE